MKCKNGILILSRAWHWLSSVGNISIRALRHNPPPHHNHDKTHSRRGVDVEDLPVSDESSAVMNYAPEHQGHLHTDEPSSGTGGHTVLFSEQKGESGMNSGCLGWIKANLSACHNVRLLWRGTCLVRMAWSHTVVQLQRSGCSTQISVRGVWQYCCHANVFVLSCAPLRDCYILKSKDYL